MKKNKRIQTREQPSSAFEQSLENLKSDDLAPKVKAKKSAARILEKTAWIAVAALLFGVFLFTGWLALRDTIDYFKAQNSFDTIAADYSPVTGRGETLLLLRPGAAIYPLPDFNDLIDGEVTYPEDPTVVSIPSLNPGGDESPTVDQPTDPETPDTSEVPSQEDPPPPPEDPNMTVEKIDQFRSALISLQKSSKNKDVFAWIYIPGTNIDYPMVIASKDRPDYYLKRSVEKEYSTAGSIYMDYRNSRNLLANRFSVIYGHNIRTRGTMFNRLIEFKNAAMFDKYRYIYIYTEEAALKYEIFSIFEDHGYNSPSIAITGFSDQTFLEKILDIQERSIHERKGLTLKASDHVLMLYTCANTTSVLTDNDIRCMVFGVLVGVTV